MLCHFRDHFRPSSTLQQNGIIDFSSLGPFVAHLFHGATFGGRAGLIARIVIAGGAAKAEHRVLLDRLSVRARQPDWHIRLS